MHPEFIIFLAKVTKTVHKVSPNHGKAVPLYPKIATSGVTFPLDYMLRDYFSDAFQTFACHFRCFVITFPSRSTHMSLGKNLQTLVQTIGFGIWSSGSSLKVPGEFPASSRTMTKLPHIMKNASRIH